MNEPNNLSGQPLRSSLPILKRPSDRARLLAPAVEDDYVPHTVDFIQPENMQDDDENPNVNLLLR